MRWRRETHSLGEGLVVEVALPQGSAERDVDYPLVVCPLPGNGHGSHDAVVNPGAATFITQLAAP